MVEVVAAPPRGLELFAASRRAKPLRVPPKKAEPLGKLGITSIQDLLQHYPRRHVDRSELRTVAELQRAAAEGSAGGEVTVHARVLKMGKPVALRPKPNQKKRRTLIKGRIGDETGGIEVTWFNQDWVARALQEGTEAFFYGRLGTFKGKLQMTAPRIEIVRSGKEPFNVGRIIPIYPATADLSSDQVRKLIWESLESVGDIMDPVPEDIVSRHRFMTRSDALRLIHFPDERDDVLAARRRIVFDEVFTLQLGLVYRKRKLERTVQGVSHVAVEAGSLAEVFLAELPFTPTGAQRRACDEVAADMARSCPMHRLLEGEVGSGKTVVALYACLVAIEGGHQAALMAPTEVLAEQHHLTVTELLDRAFGADEARHLFAGISRRPVVRLLTGSTPAVRRDEILAEVASGEVNLLIGTHALIQDAVSFKDLGMAVVDEQHRFGVHQRKSLREKGAHGEPDILVMTATPIPRTLAVTIYGDLDVSILDELPKGRQPIDTTLAPGDDAREDAYRLIRDEVAAGRQAFIVYALRDESDKVELRSAKAEAVRLANDVFPDLKVGLVHGDMRSDEKESAMATFRDGRTQVLVATTVVEVGVDVPNATVMLIEDVDRFGLAQLHQLRGRIGRGEHRSFCILATDLDLSKAPEDAAIALAFERLQAVVATSDGFKLSLVDLAQRGEGQLFGARQSGMPQLKMARVLEHQDIVKAARDEAVAILDADPELRAFEHQWLAQEMRDRFPDGALDVVQSG
ncbi:MAG: ATP-dependent DNA helicase RecG [Actinomycetota bacterium]|nr:ATP-dependent DNA helicase RecG [Actinomycetota bacterium]